MPDVLWFLRSYGASLGGLLALTCCSASSGGDTPGSPSAEGTSTAEGVGGSISSKDRSGGQAGADGKIATTPPGQTSVETGSSGGAAGAPSSSADGCPGAGHLIQLEVGGKTLCTSDIAKHKFRFAICSCQDFAWAGRLQTSSFNSASGPRGAQGKNGAVGINGHMGTLSTFDIGGSLWVKGEATTYTDGGMTKVVDSSKPAIGALALGSISGQLQCGGKIGGWGKYTVGSDFYLSDDSDIRGSLQVNGKLHIPAGKSMSGITASDGVVNEPVDVQEPCDCANPLDIPSLVASVAQTNDNAIAGVNLNDLSSGLASKELTLSCGKYYFSQVIGFEKGLTIKVTGRTAIFVHQDVNVHGRLDLELIGPGAEVDLFVGGSMKFGDTQVFGSINEPAKVRIYVGGKSLDLSGGTRLGAHFYAPHASVKTKGNLDLFGSMLADRFLSLGTTNIRYDEAILDLPACEKPASACQSCQDCAGATPACKGGTCGPCSSNADCCAPLVCDSGRCRTLLR